MPNINLYLNPPSQPTITFEKLKDICNERLKLYKILRDATNKHKQQSLLWKLYILKTVKKSNLDSYSLILNHNGEDLQEAHTVDHIAHYMLRYVFCHNFEDRDFYVRREIEILQFRYNNLKRNEIQQLVDNNPSLFGEIKEVEFEEQFVFDKELRSSTTVRDSEYITCRFYKADFSKVPQLVRARKCHLVNGKAIFAEKDLIYYMIHVLAMEFYEMLHHCKILVKDVNEVVEQLLGELEVVNETKSDIVAVDEDTYNINSINISSYANSHFPLCMKNIHDHLLEKNHLKYDMKLQYGKFLKFIGVPYEESLAFFRIHFTKKMSEQTYEKKHQYLFKHIHGKVGYTHNYAPATCDQIINANVGPLHNHGCPFKHFDRQRLEERLRNEGVSETSVRSVVDLAIQGRYKEACMKFYNDQNRNEMSMPPHNPQSYFKNSIGKNHCLDFDVADLF